MRQICSISNHFPAVPWGLLLARADSWRETLSNSIQTKKDLQVRKMTTRGHVDTSFVLLFTITLVSPELTQDNYIHHSCVQFGSQTESGHASLPYLF